MAVKVWWSEESRYTYERSAVKELCASLEPRKETYFVFVNYHIPNARIDITVFTETSIFLIELKSSAGKPVNGNSNGSWVREDGIIFDHNPVSQIVHYYYTLRNWLTKNKEQFLTKNKAAALIVGQQGNVFDDIKKLIVLCPTRHPDSRIDVDDYHLRPPMGDIIGFDELVNLIIDSSWESRLGITFTPKEIGRIAELMHLQLVPFPIDTADLLVVPSGPLGEARGIYEVCKKPEMPKKLAKKTHKRQLVLGATIAVIIIGIVVFLIIHHSPRITHSCETIDVADAANYIDNGEKIVRAYIDKVGLYLAGNDEYVILYGHNFTVQIGPVDNPDAELDRYRKKFNKHCVTIGPSSIVASGGKKPQIELEPASAMEFIHDEGVGICK